MSELTKSKKGNFSAFTAKELEIIEGLSGKTTCVDVAKRLRMNLSTFTGKLKCHNIEFKSSIKDRPKKKAVINPGIGNGRNNFRMLEEHLKNADGSLALQKDKNLGYIPIPILTDAYMLACTQY
jgi:hypothetical protein